MLVNITAIWDAEYGKYGTTAAFYEVPDEHCADDASVLSLFGKIARNFKSETDDDFAIEQIEYGFDWGIFMGCVGNDFLARYGVKRIEFPSCMAIDVDYNDIVSRY